TYDEARSGYYNVGKQTTTSDPNGSNTADYDAAGRPVQAKRIATGYFGATYTMTTTYDAGGRLLSTTYPDNDTVGTLTYDGAGRLLAIPAIVTSLSYDALGRMTSQSNANGTTTTRSFDPSKGWLTAVKTMKGAATIQNLGYSNRDDEGKLLG